MNVIRKSLLTGAQEAEGFTVIIDVLRAFTCDAVLLGLGLEHLILVDSPGEALELKQQQGYLAMGEVNGMKVEGFDFGNSPSELLNAPPGFFQDKKMVHRSSAGTRGAVAACERCSPVLLGSYVMAKSIAQVVKSSEVEAVTLVGMGMKADAKAIEDEACADYIQHLVQGTPYNHAETMWNCLNGAQIRSCLRGEVSYLPPEDVFMCLQRDLYDFVLVAEKINNQIVVRKQHISV